MLVSFLIDLGADGIYLPSEYVEKLASNSTRQKRKMVLPVLVDKE